VTTPAPSWLWQPDVMVDLPERLDLSAAQARVLGCLMEKAATTPDAYPMTLKALTTACNQTSSRHPVVSYEPTLVEATVHALKGKGLARVVHPGRGERSTKFRHVAGEALGLDAGQTAVLCVLLLRGAQTANEIRTRTDRLHTYGSPAEVEAVLDGLASDPDRPLVARVERQPGQKEGRWIQLLEVDAEQRAAAPAPSAVAASSRPSHDDELATRVAQLERRLEEVVEALGDLVDLPGTGDQDTLGESGD